MSNSGHPNTIDVRGSLSGSHSVRKRRRGNGSGRRMTTMPLACRVGCREAGACHQGLATRKCSGLDGANGGTAQQWLHRLIVAVGRGQVRK